MKQEINIIRYDPKDGGGGSIKLSRKNGKIRVSKDTVEWSREMTFDQLTKYIENHSLNPDQLYYDASLTHEQRQILIESYPL